MFTEIVSLTGLGVKTSVKVVGHLSPLSQH